MPFQDLPVPEPDPIEVTERAEEILSRAEFRQSTSLLDRVAGWLNDALNEVFGNLSGGGAGSLIGWVILVALLSALVWFVVRVRPSARLPKRPGTAAVVRTAGPAATGYRTAHEWRAEAKRLAGLEMFDEAVRARYRALLADLIDRGLVEDIPGRTPGEYRIEFAAMAPTAATPFGELTDLFESIWYGPDEAGTQDLEHFGRSEDAVLAGVAR